MNDTVILLPEGAVFPFQVKVNGEFFELETTEEALHNLKILKTCYVRCDENKNLFFSLDQKDWKDFLEFFKGRMSTSFRVKDGQPSADLELVLNKR